MTHSSTHKYTNGKRRKQYQATQAQQLEARIDEIDARIVALESKTPTSPFEADEIQRHLDNEFRLLAEAKRALQENKEDVQNVEDEIRW